MRGCAFASFSAHHLTECGGRGYARGSRVRHQALRAPLCWSSLNWEPSSGVHRPRSIEVERRPVLVTAALASPAGVLGPGSRASVPRVVARSVRGMNELGKAHPAGEARWVRVWSCLGSLDHPPARFSPKLARLTTLLPTPGQSSANCAVRGFGDPHGDDDAAGTLAIVFAGSV